MWDTESLSVAQSFLISGAGMLVVTAELAILAIAVKLFTGILSGFGNRSDKTDEYAEISSNTDDENHAVIMAVMNEELTGIKYRVTSISETGS